MGIKCLLFRNEIFKKAHYLNFEKFKFLAIAALVLLRFQIHQIRNFQFESNQTPKNHLLNVTTVNSKTIICFRLQDGGTGVSDEVGPR